MLKKELNMDKIKGNICINLRPQSEILCAVLAGFGIWIKPRQSTDDQAVTQLVSDKIPLHTQSPQHWTSNRLR